jgi:endonuclease YncB( thermonuclease family)
MRAVTRVTRLVLPLFKNRQLRLSCSAGASCRLAIAAAAIALTLWPRRHAHASPNLTEGVVVRVIDGDTLWLQSGATKGKPRKLRLAGIDAPEICQGGGVKARDALSARVLNRHVQVTSRATDDYRRTVATLRLDGEDIGAWLVQQGHAWSYGYRR